MIRKNLPPNGRMPYLRTLETGRWGDSINMEWLPPKDTEGELTEKSEGLKEESEGAMEPVPLEDRVDSRVRDFIPNNNLHTINIHACCANNNLISCDNHSSSRSSANNLAEDDATKRRGVG